MSENRNRFQFAILPVMFGFFIMGFVDIIGVTVNYVSADFSSLSEAMVSLLTSSCFIWFLVLSVPIGLLMNRIGRKNTVLLSFLVHVLAFGLIVLNYSFVTIVLAFSFVGIGNTVLQVALNPLVTNLVSSEHQTGTMTIGQLVKALCSFSGPIIVGFFTGTNYGWQAIFLVYALISLVGLVWLALTRIPKEKNITLSGNAVTGTFSLFKDRAILIFFIGILVLVGVDVGMNVSFPKYIQDTCGLDLNKASLCNSIYFLARTVGALIGGIILIRIDERLFYKISIIMALIGLVGLILSKDQILAFIFVSLFGLGYSNLFAIIVSAAMKRNPDRSNEISALMIMGVSGGGILPPVMSVITNLVGNQWSAIMVLAVVWLYMFVLIGKISSKKNVRTE